MVVKPFVNGLVWNTVAVLLAAALVPQWWTSPKRDVSAVEIRDLVHEAGGVSLHKIAPILEPASWAAAGRTTRAASFAAAVLLLLALLAIRRDLPHRLVSWVAVGVSLTGLASGIAFVALRPELGPLRPGFALIATFIATPLGAFTAWVLSRAPWSRQQA